MSICFSLVNKYKTVFHNTSLIWIRSPNPSFLLRSFLSGIISGDGSIILREQKAVFPHYSSLSEIWHVYGSQAKTNIAIDSENNKRSIHTVNDCAIFISRTLPITPRSMAQYIPIIVSKNSISWCRVRHLLNTRWLIFELLG